MCDSTVHSSEKKVISDFCGLVGRYATYTNRAMLPVNPHYMMLNTAVGGAWPGTPNASTVFPAYHYIDFVRVSQKPTY